MQLQCGANGKKVWGNAWTYELRDSPDKLDTVSYCNNYILNCTLEKGLLLLTEALGCQNY